METLLLKHSFSVAPKNFLRLSNGCDDSMLQRKKSVVHCLGRSNVTESSGLSSVPFKRSTMVNVDHGVTVIDVASLDFPNGESQAAEIAVKDMVPCSGPPTSPVDMHDGIGIIRFLRGKKFLITGATGFLAKDLDLIEKILRTTPDVDKIFLVIKAKDEEAATERMKNEIINTELFKYLQQIHGKSYQNFLLSKLVPVVGDVCKSNIGLEESLADVIAREVDVIVHSAANTTFDERYDVALDINTKGFGRLMSFANKCEKLKLFLQVSTAYVNGQRQGRIMEKPLCMGDSIARERLIFETSQGFVPALDIEGEINLALDTKEAFEGNVVASKMRELGLERARMQGWQDTYVLAKAMGEMLIDDMKGELPVVIIRPSIVESTYRDPLAGWIERNQMIDPLIQLYGKGQITGFFMDPNGVLDVVPVDMVVNAMLAAIATHGAHGKSGTNVYQVASSMRNIGNHDPHQVCHTLFRAIRMQPSQCYVLCERRGVIRLKCGGAMAHNPGDRRCGRSFLVQWNMVESDEMLCLVRWSVVAVRGYPWKSFVVTDRAVDGVKTMEAVVFHRGIEMEGKREMMKWNIEGDGELD
ncbi:hypothetical protein F0562_017228 [Nyssa sinensis]|uniref:Fatty acyl-CoA reductase n=1 Tax=Nyssa sinensis TaxID=561372 RepID=A0A5J4ZGI7_9ASTE|nr:hypothetical protein F0562_017228 [Nyssa sinensis]